MNIFTTRLTTSLVVIGTLLLSGCDSKEDAGVKTIARFKDLTPPPFSDVVAHKSDIEQEWVKKDAFGTPLYTVTDENRISFWPQHFGSIPQWIILEPTIFAWMDRFCTDYSGGIWNFYTLSNGGAFMAPEVENDELWSLFNTMNGNGGDMSAEAAGIAVCLMAFSHHACRTECDAMTEHYYRLRDYALNHAECNAIMHIID